MKRKTNADVVDEKKNKKNRVMGGMARDNASYTLIVYQVKAFAHMLEVMGSVLKDCLFTATREESGFSGLSVQCIDDRHCCIVMAKLQCELLVADESSTKFTFCVPVNVLLTHVKSISSNYCLKIYQTNDSPDLKLQVTSPVVSHSRSMSIATLQKENNPFDVDDINYDFSVEKDLGEFQRILKMAKAINCDHIRIRILEKNTNPKMHFLIMHVYGENSYDEHCFASLTEIKDNNENGKIIMKSTENAIGSSMVDPGKISISELKETFNSVFGVDYLNSFIRSLDRHTVIMRLAPKRPLVLVSSLGDENSFVSIILAPRNDDDQFPNEIHSFKK